MDGVTKTRKKIIDAAINLFDLHGPQKTTMIEVSNKAGVARATLYLHFPNKSALYTATLMRGMDEMVASVGQLILEPISAQRKLRQWVELTATIYSGNKVFFRALTEATEFTIQAIAEKVMQAHRQQLLVMLTQILRQGVQDGDLREFDTVHVAELMYDLGTVLVVNSLSGTGSASLSVMLGVMDDIFHQGISARSSP